MLLGAGLGLALVRVPGLADACVPGLADACVLGHAGARVLAHAVVPGVVAEIFGGVVLVFYRAAGHAVRLTRFSHALAGGDLPSLVLSHDRFFPGEAARVCSPW